MMYIHSNNEIDKRINVSKMPRAVNVVIVIYIFFCFICYAV